MFDTPQDVAKAKEQNELLEIFLLIDQNTMKASVEALGRYSNLYGIKDKVKANELMRQAYKDFNQK